jgi:hypothetical protein
MIELDKYKDKNPFGITNDEIDHLVNNSTERAIEQHHDQRPTLRRLALWTATAAAILGAVFMTVRMLHQDTEPMTSQSKMLAINDLDTSEAWLAVDQVDIEPTLTDAKADEYDGPAEEMKEVDELLETMTDDELDAIDYFVDEIPEY